MAFAFAGHWGPEPFFRIDGTPLALGALKVYEVGTTTLATTYTDRTKATEADGIFSTDGDGNGSFFADPGEYEIAFVDSDTESWRILVSVPIDPDDAVETVNFDGGSVANAVTFNDLVTLNDGTELPTDYVTQTAGDAAYAPLAHNHNVPNTVVLLGDSITAQNGPAGTGSTPWYHDSIGYFTWANILLGHRLRLLSNEGVGGETAAQIAARVGDVTSQSPGWCVVLAGVNTITASGSTADVTNALTTIYDALDTAGVRVVACTIIGKTDHSATQIANTRAANVWVRKEAALRGYPLADFAAAITDPATGTSSTSLVDTGTPHPNPEGASLLGLALAEALDPVVPFTNPIDSAAESGNLAVNPMFTGDTAGLATSWDAIGASGADGHAKVGRTDGIQGEWQQITCNGVALTGLRQRNFDVGTTWNVGDDVVLRVEFETDANLTDVEHFYARLGFYNSGGTSVGDATDLRRAGSSPALNNWPARGVFETPTVTIPATTTELRILLQANLVGKIRFARAEMRIV